jgi:hypothetical protein
VFRALLALRAAASFRRCTRTRARTLTQLARVHAHAHAHVRAAAKTACFTQNLYALRGMASPPQRGGGAWPGVPGAPLARLSAFDDDDLLGSPDGLAAMTATYGGAPPNAFLYHGRPSQQQQAEVQFSRSATRRASAAAPSSDGGASTPCHPRRETAALLAASGGAGRGGGNGGGGAYDASLLFGERTPAPLQRAPPPPWGAPPPQAPWGAPPPTPASTAAEARPRCFALRVFDVL